MLYGQVQTLLRCFVGDQHTSSPPNSIDSVIILPMHCMDENYAINDAHQLSSSFSTLTSAHWTFNASVGYRLGRTGAYEYVGMVRK